MHTAGSHEHASAEVRAEGETKRVGRREWQTPTVTVIEDVASVTSLNIGTGGDGGGGAFDAPS
jgi:hypothetical protein